MKNITYKDVMKVGFKLLKEESETIYGCDMKDQAEAAVHMTGVIDTISALRELFEETEEKDN